MADEEEISFKILILGEQSVGKTSFITRFCDDIFNEVLTSTIGIDIKDKTIERNNKKIQLKIFDTAGQERYQSISKNYFKSADGILLLYDISKKETFEKIKKWIENIEEAVDLSGIGLVVVGNKSDVPDEERQISDANREDLEQKLNTKIIEASAKNNENIEKSFLMLVDKMYELKFGVKLNKENYRKDSLVIENDSKQKNVKKQCCK